MKFTSINEITGTHLSAIADQERISFDPFLTATVYDIEARFKRGHRILVARDKNKIVGKIGFYFGSYDPKSPENLPHTFHEYTNQVTRNRDSNCIYVYNLDVLPEYRNGGDTAKQLSLSAFLLAHKLGKKYAIGDVNCGAFNGSRPGDKNQLRKDFLFNQAILAWDKSGIIPDEKLLKRNPYFNFYSRILGLKPLVLRPQFVPEDKPAGGYHFYGVSDLKALFKDPELNNFVLPYKFAQHPAQVADGGFQPYERSSYWGQPVPQILDYLEGQKLGGLLFEACAGNGRYTSSLASHFDEIYCSDIDSESLKWLIQRIPQERDKDLRPIPEDIQQSCLLHPESADVTTCFAALHFFEPDDIARILKVLKGATKPGGKVIIDFSTDIQRKRPDGSFIQLDPGVPSYTLPQALNMIEQTVAPGSLQEIMTGQIENLPMGRGPDRYFFSGKGFVATLAA